MKTEFELELRKLQQFANTHSKLIEALKDNTTFIECLLEEFKKAPKVKDFSKFLNQFKTRKERYEQSEKELDFLRRKDITEKFYTHNIFATNIYKSFSVIETALRALKHSLAEPTQKAELIISIIPTLHPDIQVSVIDALIDDNLNLNLIKPTQKDIDEWNYVKAVFNDKLSQYKENLPKGYIGIAEKLSHYIKGATDYALTYIIDRKKLPPEKQEEKPIWIGDKADAVRFCDKTGLKISEFNKCFVLFDGKKLLDANRSKDTYIDGDGKAEITNIIQEILN